MNDNSIFTYNNNNTSCKINTMYINEEKRGRAIRWCLYHFYHLNPTSHFVLIKIPKIYMISNKQKKKKFFFLYNLNI